MCCLLKVLGGARSCFHVLSWQNKLAMTLAGQVCVITGGAGGIGWSSAQQWLAQGGKVLLAYLQEAKGTDIGWDIG